MAAEELEAGRAVVRAVIVRTWGSTPREVGADLLVDQSGALYGTVGGGCGEAEVYELAQELLTRPGPNAYLYHVDLTETPEAGGEKVCGGRFDVLLTRLDPEPHSELLRSLNAGLGHGQTLGWWAHTGYLAPGFWKSGQSCVGLDAELTIGPTLEEPGWSLGDGGQHAFCEPLGLAWRLVIVGAGHIARPLCVLASQVGYRVSVLDDRPEFAQPHFFPDAAEVVAGDYLTCLPSMTEAPHTSVVLVTRGHRHDQECLRLMAGRTLDYLGMIGSQRRIDAVYAELVQDGSCRLEDLQQVFAPIGLEIGARTPSEIAIAIVAQMIRVRRLEQRDRASADRRRRVRTLLGE